ncbi:hypothetical protein BKA93DRAFT_752185 [Sparassis latifolia]
MSKQASADHLTATDDQGGSAEPSPPSTSGGTPAVKNQVLERSRNAVDQPRFFSRAKARSEKARLGGKTKYPNALYKALRQREHTSIIRRIYTAAEEERMRQQDGAAERESTSAFVHPSSGSASSRASTSRTRISLDKAAGCGYRICWRSLLVHQIMPQVLAPDRHYLRLEPSREAERALELACRLIKQTGDVLDVAHLAHIKRRRLCNSAQIFRRRRFAHPSSSCFASGVLDARAQSAAPHHAVPSLAGIGRALTCGAAVRSRVAKKGSE